VTSLPPRRVTRLFIVSGLLAFLGLMMADHATCCRPRHAMVARIMSRDAAVKGPFDAAFGIGRNRRDGSKQHQHRTTKNRALIRSLPLLSPLIRTVQFRSILWAVRVGGAQPRVGGGVLAHANHAHSVPPLAPPQNSATLFSAQEAKARYTDARPIFSALAISVGPIPCAVDSRTLPASIETERPL
jgi:hypothetical protein